jgi:hypothetical protein
MRFRNLRIAWSVVCSLACVLFVWLWIRSYMWVDAVRLTAAPSGGAIQFVSIPGRLGIGQMVPAKPWSFFRMSANQWREVTARSSGKIPSEFIGGIIRNKAVDQIFVPYWLLVLGSTVVGCAPWLGWRFSLRALLVGTALVAVVLGLAVWAAHR